MTDKEPILLPDTNNDISRRNFIQIVTTSYLYSRLGILSKLLGGSQTTQVALPPESIQPETTLPLDLEPARQALINLGFYDGNLDHTHLSGIQQIIDAQANTPPPYPSTPYHLAQSWLNTREEKAPVIYQAYLESQRLKTSQDFLKRIQAGHIDQAHLHLWDSIQAQFVPLDPEAQTPLQSFYHQIQLFSDTLFPHLTDRAFALVITPGNPHAQASALLTDYIIRTSETEKLAYQPATTIHEILHTGTLSDLILAYPLIATDFLTLAKDPEVVAKINSYDPSITIKSLTVIFEQIGNLVDKHQEVSPFYAQNFISRSLQTILEDHALDSIRGYQASLDSPHSLNKALYRAFYDWGHQYEADNPQTAALIQTIINPNNWKPEFQGDNQALTQTILENLANPVTTIHHLRLARITHILGFKELLNAAISATHHYLLNPPDTLLANLDKAKRPHTTDDVLHRDRYTQDLVNYAKLTVITAKAQELGCLIRNPQEILDLLFSLENRLRFGDQLEAIHFHGFFDQYANFIKAIIFPGSTQIYGIEITGHDQVNNLRQAIATSYKKLLIEGEIDTFTGEQSSQHTMTVIDQILISANQISGERDQTIYTHKLLEILRNNLKATLNNQPLAEFADFQQSLQRSLEQPSDQLPPLLSADLTD